MIISFYDKDFNGLQNNASLVVDDNSYSLIRRGVDMDELKCICEPFTESIQPTFIVVKNDVGNYIYGCLAGIPELTKERKTVITGSDLKSMLKSDIAISTGTLTTVNTFLSSIFNAWNLQVNQGTVECELIFEDSVGNISFGAFEYLNHSNLNGVFNVWDDIFSPYLKYYGLYMTAKIDLVSKKVVFEIGKSMLRETNVKLWELGIYDYGKWVAGVNETKGMVFDKATESFISGTTWTLLSNNVIATNSALRDVYPVKRKIFLKELGENDNLAEAKKEVDIQALEYLCDSMFKENIEVTGIQADFETKFNIYVRRGEPKYKSLPCGELHYNASGLTKIQIGYRFNGLQFIL